MKGKKHTILGVHITDRVHHAGEVQKVLTESGCCIKTRLGLHEVSDRQCAPNGLVLLEVAGTDGAARALARKLRSIRGVQVKAMVFTHP